MKDREHAKVREADSDADIACAPELPALLVPGGSCSALCRTKAADTTQPVDAAPSPNENRPEAVSPAIHVPQDTRGRAPSSRSSRAPTAARDIAAAGL